MNDAWAEQYEAWLDARFEGLSEDEPAEDECPMCRAEVNPDYRYCRSCQEFV